MSNWKNYIAVCIFVCILAVAGALVLSEAGSAVTAMSAAPEEGTVFVLDAGHGGEDGGAVSTMGTRESDINLEVAGRLNILMNFLGMKTKMVRTTDISVYTEGTTIAQKKVSDIRHRVQIVEETPGAVLVSIHQNCFPQAQYRGAQVFYAKGSEALAELLQRAMCTHVDPNNHRECKPIRDVYLMEHITCPGVLIECGFLSNPQEEQLLKDPGYQKKLAAAIACTLLSYLEDTNEV